MAPGLAFMGWNFPYMHGNWVEGRYFVLSVVHNWMKRSGILLYNNLSVFLGPLLRPDLGGMI
jgi:hypothetical protein